METIKDINKDNFKNQSLPNVVNDLTIKTSWSVLLTIYRGAWVFQNVIDIITWKPINPSRLVEDLSAWRLEYRQQASNEREFAESINK